MNIDQFGIVADYFDLAAVGTSLQALIINILVLSVMTIALSFVYVKTANTLSNRKRMAAVFPLLSIVTMMVISVIRYSLALSLGLVGALSIVRFRSAIKEPEELAYIFLSISLGLGMGADQQALTIVFFILVCVFILVKNYLEGKINFLNYKTDQTLYLNLSFSKPDLGLVEITRILEKYCHFIDLKRLDESVEKKELMFVIKAKDYQQLSKLKQKLLAVDKTMAVSILNDEQLFV